MAEPIAVLINGQSIAVTADYTVAAAVALANQERFRTSVTGEGRGPLCGMGICFECRVRINGRPHSKSCQVVCQPGMDIKTGE